jgi:hypothetical protein
VYTVRSYYYVRTPGGRCISGRISIRVPGCTGVFKKFRVLEHAQRMHKFEIRVYQYTVLCMHCAWAVQPYSSTYGRRYGTAVLTSSTIYLTQGCCMMCSRTSIVAAAAVAARRRRRRRYGRSCCQYAYRRLTRFYKGTNQ